MSKHTPGPWNFRRNDYYWEFGNEEVQLGDVCASQCTDPGKEEANARLIAAAPDLLEACRVASALLKGAPRSLGYYFDARQLDAAIQKAVGAEHA